ncbi:MAG: sulfite exporter TauE/SafE family protein [Mycobacterium sp.]
MTALTVVLAVLVGISLGLLGGGGSILMVPLLAYVAGMEPRHAIAMSLLVVGVTSAVGSITHARAGRVQWRIATYFGVAAMAGAYGGGRLAAFIPGTALMVGFAVIMIAAAIAMLRGRKGAGATETGHGLPVFKIVVLGLGVGAVSGLVGAGGGFLLVPALAILGGLAMPAAVGTSLVVIAMQSFAGLAGHLTTEHIDLRLAAMVTGAAVVGAVVGGRLVGRIDPNALRRLFGWFVLMMAAVILAEETTPVIGAAVAGLTLIAAGVYLACTRSTHCPVRRLISRRHIGAGAT